MDLAEKIALDSMRKKYKPSFSDNREQLENPSDQDNLAMDKITLEELAENARDSRRIGNKNFIKS